MRRTKIWMFKKHGFYRCQRTQLNDLNKLVVYSRLARNVRSTIRNTRAYAGLDGDHNACGVALFASRKLISGCPVAAFWHAGVSLCARRHLPRNAISARCTCMRLGIRPFRYLVLSFFLSARVCTHT